MNKIQRLFKYWLAMLTGTSKRRRHFQVCFNPIHAFAIHRKVLTAWQILLCWTCHVVRELINKYNVSYGTLKDDVLPGTRQGKIFFMRWMCWSAWPVGLLYFLCVCSPKVIKEGLLKCSKACSSYHHNVHAVAKEGTGITAWPVKKMSFTIVPAYHLLWKRLTSSAEKCNGRQIQS